MKLHEITQIHETVDLRRTMRGLLQAQISRNSRTGNLGLLRELFHEFKFLLSRHTLVMWVPTERWTPEQRVAGGQYIKVCIQFVVLTGTCI